MLQGKSKIKKLRASRMKHSFFYYSALLLKSVIFIGDVTKTAINIPFIILSLILAIQFELLTGFRRFCILLASPLMKKIKVVKKKGHKIRKISIKEGFLLRRRLLKFIRLSRREIKYVGRFVVFTIKRIVWQVIYLFLFILDSVLSVFIWVIKSAVFILKFTVFLPYRFIFRILTPSIRYFTLGFAVCFSIVFTYQLYTTVKSLPTPYDIGKINYSLSTHIYDSKERLLYDVYREQNRTPVKLKTLPPYIGRAIVAVEDKDFYKHNGISVSSGMIRAVRDMVLTKTLQGGSTITQQLVKSALLSPERTVTRKVKEIFLALWAERVYTKDQILEMYVNQVPYGGSSYGIEEAANTYFGKHAKDLTLEEATMLAGLPQAPSLYSPFINPKLAKSRQSDVLRNMYEQGYISRERMLKAKSTELNIIAPEISLSAPHFVFYVKSVLERRYGIRQVEEGGFNVYTTLNLDIQKKAEQILKEELEKVAYLNVTNGAILVTRPQTGEILAMVGSVDYFDSPSGAYNVTTAFRQPGSSIKPIMYALALEKGYTAASVIDDKPIVYSYRGGPSYRPVNYDGKYHGRVTLRQALANSFNIPAVKVLDTIGVDDFVDHARKMGISTWNDPSRFGLSLTLGGGEVMMVDMAKAFGVFANSGYRVDLTGVSRLEDYRGRLVEKSKPQPLRVLDEGVSYIISDILSDNKSREWAFGPNSALEVKNHRVAVKTGTTDNKKDNWTIGYTPDFLVAVWVGNNDGTPMNPHLASGITGAAPIWNRVMEFLLENYGEEKPWYNRPENIVEKVCNGKKEFFVSGTDTVNDCTRPDLSNKEK